jgi:tripartite ATP-independent transporter DctP family solute receptor
MFDTKKCIRRAGATAMSATAAVVLAACGGGASAATAEHPHLVIAATLPDTTAMVQGAERIVGSLAADEDLDLTAEVYAAGQLGGEPAMLDSLSIGTVDIAMVGASLVATHCPQLGATSLPYVLEGKTPDEQYANLARVSESGVNDEAVERCAADTGYRVLADDWWYGNRHTTSNTPIETPDDMRGLRVRTPEGALHAAPFAELGAQPVPMAQSEVYTALETGIVDGQENPFATTYLQSFHDVQEYLNLTGLMTHTQMLVMSEERYRSLTPAQRDGLVAAIDEAGRWQSDEQLAYNEEMRDKLVEAGMEIVEPDLDRFRDALTGFVEGYADEHDIDLAAVRAVQVPSTRKG